MTKEEFREDFLAIKLPPKDYLVDNFPKSNLKTPITYFCHSLADYRNWFYQISLLFDENNKFTLVNKDHFMEPNFPEKYAFALFQSGKFNLSFDLFSLFIDYDNNISKRVLENGKIFYPDFGLEPGQLGILGIEAYAKVCGIKHKTDDALVLALKIVNLDQNCEYSKSIIKAMLYSYELLISHEEDDEVKNYLQNKRQEILKKKY